MGREVVTEPEPERPTNVVDLADVLRQSVEQAKGSRKGGAKKPAGGKKTPKSPDLSGLNKSELNEMAREFGVRGRSKMSRSELEKAVAKAGESAARQKAAS